MGGNTAAAISALRKDEEHVEQGGVYSIYYKVLYSLPEGSLGV